MLGGKRLRDIKPVLGSRSVRCGARLIAQHRKERPLTIPWRLVARPSRPSLSATHPGGGALPASFFQPATPQRYRACPTSLKSCYKEGANRLKEASVKAAFFKEHGGAEKVLYDDYRDPVPGPDDVVVRVGACGLNHVDILLLDGRFPPPEGLPHVNGCAGTGVGSAAIQIARLVGARVITTVGSDDKTEFARSLGAERVVNYRTHDFVEAVRTWTNKRGVDVVVEHIGGETFEKSILALTRLGTLVTIGSHDTHWGRLDLRHVYSKNLRVVGTNLGSILELRTILDYVTAGRLEPVIDRAFPLKDARAAVQYVLDRKNKGKVLLIP